MGELTGATQAQAGSCGWACTPCCHLHGHSRAGHWSHRKETQVEQAWACCGVALAAWHCRPCAADEGVVTLAHVPCRVPGIYYQSSQCWTCCPRSLLRRPAGPSALPLISLRRPPLPRPEVQTVAVFAGVTSPFSGLLRGPAEHPCSPFSLESCQPCPLCSPPVRAIILPRSHHLPRKSLTHRTVTPSLFYFFFLNEWTRNVNTAFTKGRYTNSQETQRETQPH